MRDAQWRSDGPVGADIVKWALDEAYVVKQRRSGEMVLLNWSGRAPVPVTQVEEHQSRKLRIPVQVLVGTVAPSFPLSQMLLFSSFSELIFLPFFSLELSFLLCFVYAPTKFLYFFFCSSHQCLKLSLKAVYAFPPAPVRCIYCIYCIYLQSALDPKAEKFS